MKHLLTTAILVIALGIMPTGAFAGKGKGKGSAYGQLKKSDPVVIEAAAKSLSLVIASDSGGSGERYMRYAHRLAQTLDQKSSAELDRVLGPGNHFGLGN